MLDTLTAYYLYENYKNRSEGRENFNLGGLMMPDISPLIWLFSLAVGVLAGWLAYHCNQRTDPALRILITVIAFFLGGWYLIYFFIRYYLMKDKC